MAQAAVMFKGDAVLQPDTRRQHGRPIVTTANTNEPPVFVVVFVFVSVQLHSHT